jgi:uncharacterized protein (TIGR02453 family)
MDKVLQFLQELKENNNREWFNANKKRYNESKEKILFLTDVFINEIGKFDPTVRGVSPKECIFRIFRDVRFSKDKQPYKTNFGSFIAKGGRKSMHPGYYFHIEPKQSFIGGGMYMPPAEPLRAIRNHLAEHGSDFKAIIYKDAFKDTFPEMYDHRLKTAPKGFPKEHEFIELLRYKSFVFSYPVSNNKITNDSFINDAILAFEQLSKANLFLSEALEI